jgi:hypothetical protein
MRLVVINISTEGLASLRYADNDHRNPGEGDAFYVAHTTVNRRPAFSVTSGFVYFI